MRTNELQSLGSDDIKIGPAHHLNRNLWIAAGALLGGLTLVAFFSYFHKQDATDLELLARFRTAYAEKCDAPSFAEPVSALRDLYLHSSILKTAVDRQMAALEHGASCESVARALRSADFPMPSSAPSVRVP
jgi:hypothetical protein